MIEGTAPYVQHRFSKKQEMMDRQAEGSKAKNKRAKPPRDFNADYLAAMHIADGGWHGIPAPAFRSAMISACRLVGFQMTKAKLSVFVDADGFDKEDGTPLVKIIGEPQMVTHTTRNETGVADVRARPMFRIWSAVIVLTYDADQFNETDVANLLSRAGAQVGIGEGRPDSKASAGMGWGTFRIQ